MLLKFWDEGEREKSKKFNAHYKQEELSMNIKIPNILGNLLSHYNVKADKKYIGFLNVVRLN